MSEVTLHVYDVTNKAVIGYLNAVTKGLGHVGGAFHGGVEVNGVEYSFGYMPEGHSGVYEQEPKQSDQHKYRESICMGKTQKESGQVLAIVERLKREWQGPSYDVLTRNCCHFSAALIDELDVPEKVPAWLNRFAGIGSKGRDLGEGIQAKATEANRSMKAEDSTASKIKNKASNLVGKIGAKFGKK
eukprot:TRINITY_DN8882_c0_g1_i2.p2 TRINITY_DN8882_c0_g1~~TRINITY_DN8882_c0_g1_i2.p2  ORF type:complete len:187 (+),score=73.47 TRINITY_DN8882_c0_g1_i2:83-643(+)